MNHSKIKVGQRVRAVLTETSGPVPLCEGKIIVVDDSGNALVEYDDGWSRWYHRPTVELIDPEEKDTPQWDGHLLLEIERLREENTRLRFNLDRSSEVNRRLISEVQKNVELANKAISALERLSA